MTTQDDLKELVQQVVQVHEHKIFQNRKNNKWKNTWETSRNTEHFAMNYSWVLGEWIREVIVGEADFVDTNKPYT